MLKAHFAVVALRIQGLKFYSSKLYFMWILNANS